MKKEFLNCEGLRCPMPIVEVSKKMKTLAIGDELEVKATDNVFIADMKAWANKTQNEIIDIKSENNIHHVLLKKIVE